MRKKSNVFIVFFGILANVMSLDTEAHDADPTAKNPRLTPEVIAVQRVLPSVVNIATEKLVSVSDPFDAFFRDFFNAPTKYYRKAIPLGSGVIVDKSGLILTNYHVVRRASNIEVHLLDGEKYGARLAAYNEKNDLALLMIDGADKSKQFKEIEFAAPDDLLLGETVIAAGNPFGLEHTVTSGVVSARNRSLQEGDVVFSDIIQTDAAINPGNSGGPLINLDGDLVGLNLAIRAGAEGIGFAIPLRRIEEVLAAWLLPSHFSSGTCGFVPATNVLDGSLKAVVKSVEPDGVAARAGLENDDMITQINAHKVQRAMDASRILWRLRPGDSCTVKTADGRDIKFKIATMNVKQLIDRRIGLRIQTLTPQLRSALKLHEKLNGLVVSEVNENGAASQLEVKRGDILYAVGRIPVQNAQTLADVLEKLQPGEKIDLRFILFREIYGDLVLKPYDARITLQ